MRLFSYAPFFIVVSGLHLFKIFRIENRYEESKIEGLDICLLHIFNCIVLVTKNIISINLKHFLLGLHLKYL